MNINTQAKWNIRKALSRAGIITVEFLLVAFLLVWAALIVVNDTQDYTSFWFGLGSLFVLALLVGGIGAAVGFGRKSGLGEEQTAGRFIMIGMIIGVLALIFAFFIGLTMTSMLQFNWADFGRGLLTLVLIILTFAILRLSAWLCYRVPKPKSAPAATAPAPQAAPATS